MEKLVSIHRSATHRCLNDERRAVNLDTGTLRFPEEHLTDSVAVMLDWLEIPP